MIRLELHSWKGVKDLTDYVSALTWSEGTDAPWDWISTTLRIPLALIFSPSTRITRNDAGVAHQTDESYLEEKDPLGLLHVVASTATITVDVGYWLKLLDVPSGRCLAYGCLDTRQTGLQASATGGVNTQPTVIKTIGALEFLRLQKCEVYATLSEDIGGIMSFSGTRFKRYWAHLQRVLKQPNPSDIVGVNGILSTIAPVKLPPTLFPGVSTLGELFVTAHDDDSGRKNAPLRMMDKVPLPFSGGLRWVIPSGSVLDLLMSVFQPEPRLVELMPSLESASNDPSSMEYGSARPVLIHRIRPWRVSPVRKMNKTANGSDITSTRAFKTYNGTIVNVTVPTSNPSDNVFSRQTWKLPLGNMTPGSGLYIDASSGYRFGTRRTNSARANLVTVDWSLVGASAPKFLGLAGLPIYDKLDIERNGPRELSISWDLAQFDPDESAIGRILSLSPVEFLRSLALQAWQFYGVGHVFEAGTMEGPYLGTSARAGEVVMFDYGGGLPFVAYMTRVTHSISVQRDSSIDARTTIEFDRGLWNEKGRDPNFYAEEKENVSEPEDATPVDTACHEGRPSATYSASTPSASFPSSLSVVNFDNILVSLTTWGVDRGFPSSVLHNVDDAQQDERKRATVSVACAKVIEMYWKQMNPDAEIHICASTRTTDTDEAGNHRFSAAIDFSIKNGSVGQAVGALQTWASLRKLIAAGRIPDGGRGLYLNLNGTNNAEYPGNSNNPSGITGTSDGSAGQASRTPATQVAPMPRGGSGGVHYDYRGFFGFTPSRRRAKWLQIDTNGDGSDELVDIQGSSPASEYLRAVLPSAAIYYGTDGTQDSTLAEVGDTVPNVNQLLGLEPYCS